MKPAAFLAGHAAPALDPKALEEYVVLLGSRTLAAKVGFFLESRREHRRTR
jgi:hypothetical protein